MPELISQPIFVLHDADTAAILIDDTDRYELPVVVTLRKDAVLDNRNVNAITSIYGLEHPEYWVNNQIEEGKHLEVFNQEKASAFFRTYGYKHLGGKNQHLLSGQIVSQTTKTVNPQNQGQAQNQGQNQNQGQAQNQGPTQNQSPKHAVRGSRDLQQQVSDLQKQNKRLEKKVNWLKGQMKQGQGVANVSKVAGEVLKQFDSQYDKQKLTSRLQTLYDAMDSYGTIQQTMNQQEWRQEARSIAEDVLEETVQLNDELYRQYEDLRKELRNTKFHVPRKLWGELEIKDGYNEFRKKNMGRMKMSSKDGVSIEDVYTDLSYRHPELFNLDAHMDEAEQILHIAEVLESIQPRYESELAGNDMAIDYLAGDLIERFFDLPQNKATFADRQAQKLDREVAKTARRGERALQQQAARYEKQRNIEREQREKAISRMQKSMQRQAEQNEKRFQKLKEVHEFELPDGKLTLTTAQIMSLYALSKRQQAMDHIYTV